MGIARYALGVKKSAVFSLDYGEFMLNINNLYSSPSACQDHRSDNDSTNEVFTIENQEIDGSFNGDADDLKISSAEEFDGNFKELYLQFLDKYYFHVENLMVLKDIENLRYNAKESDAVIKDFFARRKYSKYFELENNKKYFENKKEELKDENSLAAVRDFVLFTHKEFYCAAKDINRFAAQGVNKGFFEKLHAQRMAGNIAEYVRKVQEFGDPAAIQTIEPTLPASDGVAKKPKV